MCRDFKLTKLLIFLVFIPSQVLGLCNSYELFSSYDFLCDTSVSPQQFTAGYPFSTFRSQLTISFYLTPSANFFSIQPIEILRLTNYGNDTAFEATGRMFALFFNGGCLVMQRVNPVTTTEMNIMSTCSLPPNKIYVYMSCDWISNSFFFKVINVESGQLSTSSISTFETAGEEYNSSTSLIIGGMGVYYQACSLIERIRVKNYFSRDWFLDYNPDGDHYIVLQYHYQFDKINSNTAFEQVTGTYAAVGYQGNTQSFLILDDDGLAMNQTTKIKLARWKFFELGSFTMEISLIVTSLPNCQNYIFTKSSSDGTIRFGIYINPSLRVSYRGESNSGGTPSNIQIQLNTPTTLIFSFTFGKTFVYMSASDGSLIGLMDITGSPLNDTNINDQDLYIGDGVCSFTGTIKKLKVYKGLPEAITNDDCKFSPTCSFGYGNFSNLVCVRDSSITCTAPQYLDRFLECTDCPSGCSACSKRSNCSSCNSGFYLYDSKCLSTCPFLYKGNTTTRMCDPDPDYCISDTNCTLAAKPKCYVANNTCETCIADNNCPANSYCSNYKCVPCYLDTHCNTLATPNYRCNTTSNLCQKCLYDSDCSAISSLEPICYNGNCFQCIQNSNCGSRLGKPVCKPSTSSCVGCLTNSNCLGNTPKCDTTRNLCVECFSDQHCSPLKPYCYPTDNKCKECYNNSHCNNILTGNLSRFCTSKFFCFTEPTLEFLGPTIINGEFNIFLFYLLTTSASSGEYNVTWTFTSSSSSLSKKNALASLLASITKTFIEIPYFNLEIGVEYNFTVTYMDDYGYVKTRKIHTLPTCPREKYLIIGQGCAGTCLRGCFVCDNPFTCIECAPFAVFNSTSLGCDMFSSISISSTEKLTPKSTNIISASIDIQELGYYTPTYRWGINSLSQPIWSNTTSFMNSQSDYLIYLPGGYLRPSSYYQLQVSYINYIGKNISNSLEIYVGSGQTPAIQIDGGSNQILKRNVQNILKLFSQDPSENYGMLTVIWIKTAGPELIASQPSTTNPMWFTIPACSLQEGAVYKFRATYSVDKIESLNSIDFTGKVMNDTFTVEIINGNRSHPSTYPLFLESEITFDVECDEDRFSDFSYKWTCINTTSTIQINCSDSLNIFGVYSSSGSLNVPQSYYSTGQTYIFTLIALKNSKFAQTSTEIIIASSNTLIIKTDCLLSKCSKYYSIGTPLLLFADILGVNSSSYNSLNFTWSITPTMSFITLGNKFFLTSNSTNPAGTTLKISTKVSNATHQGEGFLILKYNNPPTSGNFTILPVNGEALITIFKFYASRWLDDDTPLKYQYFYQPADSTESNWKSLGDSRLHPDLDSYLPASPPSQILEVKLVVSDFYSATSEERLNVTVINQASSFIAIQSTIKNILSSTANYDSAQIAKSLSLISSQILISEGSSAVNTCPFCSGHGSCDKNNLRCTCDSGWSGYDCNISNATMTEILNTKLEILSRFETQFNNDTDTGLKVMIMSSLKDLTSNPIFNNATTINSTENLLENKLKILSPSTSLSDSEKKDLTNVLSNVIQYKSADDCSCELESCRKYSTKLNDYFNKIASDSMTIPNLGASPIEYSTPIYDLSIKQASICEVESTDLLNLESNQKLRLIEIEYKPHDCNQIVAIKTFAIQDESQLFNCGSDFSQAKTKSKYGVSVNIISSGTDISSDYSIIIRDPASKQCPKQCISENTGGVLICKCPKAVEFDPSTQIKSIFTASELDTILKFDALANWNPTASPVFWFNFIIVAWFITTLVLLNRPKLKNLTIEHMIEDPSIKRVIIYNFMTENELLAIYYVQDKELSKIMRLEIYLVKILLLGLFNALFGSALSNLSVLEMITNLQILIILLPYWTMLPINILLTLLIKKGMKESSDTKKVTKNIVIVLLSIITIIVIMATFIIAVNNDASWERKWFLTMIINLFFDIFFNPWIKVLLTVIIYYVAVEKVSKPVEGLKVAMLKSKIFPSNLEKKQSVLFKDDEADDLKPKNSGINESQTNPVDINKESNMNNLISGREDYISKEILNDDDKKFSKAMNFFKSIELNEETNTDIENLKPK